MPYAAISYRVKEGYEDDLARLFSNIGRVSSPVLHDESGKEVGMLLGTAVFIEGPMIVRFIHYSGGTLEDVARHMSHQPAVHNFEEALQPYLAEERDTTTPEAFREFFTKSTMRCLTQASLESWKAEAAGAQVLESRVAASGQAVTVLRDPQGIEFAVVEGTPSTQE